MPTCPHCNRQFQSGHAKSELEAYIKANQPKLGHFINLKREITSEFGVKKFADLPPDKYVDALKFAKEKVEFLTAVWGANKTLAAAIPAFLKNVPRSNEDLETKLDRTLRQLQGERYWADLDPEQAVIAIRKIVGEQNIWEFAYASITISVSVSVCSEGGE